jgi:PAS domain S-box-containing protein
MGELRKANDIFEIILQGITDPVLLISKDLKVLWANKVFQDQTGFKREETIGNYCYRVTHHQESPCQLPYDLCPISDAEKTCKTVTTIHTHFDKEGNKIFVQVSAYPIKDDKGNIIQFVCMYKDITEMKKIEENLRVTLEESRKSQAEISALLEASSAVLKYPDFNGAARAIFNSCKNLIRATSGYIALLSKDGAENEVLFLDSGGLPCTVDPKLPMPIRGLRGEAYQSVKTVYDNAFAGSKWMEFMPEGHVKLNNVMFAPMVIEGKAVGLLGIANKQGGFTENDARLASAFAELGAIALVQKRAEEALKDSEERYRSLVELSPDAIAIHSKGKYVYMNPSGVKLFGATEASEIEGKKVLDLVHPDYQKIVSERIQLSYEQRIQTPIIELKIVLLDGRSVDVEAMSTPIIYRGNPTTQLVLRDITERKKAEESLRYEREKLINILDSIPDGVYIVNGQYDIEYVNPFLQKIYGPVNGQKCYEYFEGQKEVCSWCKGQEVFKDKKTCRWEWYSPKTKKTYDLIDTPLINPDGSISKLEIFRDITERKRTEEALEKSNQRLAILSETASQLLKSDMPQQIVEDLCSKVMAYLDCHVFLNFLLDEEKQRLHLNAYSGISEKTAKDIEWLDLAVAVCGITACDGCPIVYENIPETKDPRIDHIRSLGIKAYACYPLFSQDRVIGTLSFGTRSRLSFTEDELVLIKTVAGQVSIAIMRMMILKELKRKVQERTAELNKAYETVEAERQRFRDVLDVLPAYVVLLSPDYHVTFANRFFEERFGKSNGQRCYEYLFNRTEPCEICETYTVLKTNAPHHWEWTGPDGRNYDIYDFPFKDTDGSTLIMEVGLDITKRKQAEMAIKEREKKYRTLIEQAAEAIAIFDQQLNFIDVNSAACQITGFTRDELLNLNAKDLIPEEDFASIPPQLAEVIAGKTLANESRLRRKDGTLINIRVSAKMLEDGMVQTITRDITERKKTEERNRLITNLLELFIKTSSRKEYLDSVVDMLQEWTGCRCIGIRILDKDGNIPYESYRGFSQDFWQQENWISFKNQCACTRVVLQKPDPQDMSMMTPNGSFRCNNTEKFARGLTEKDLSRYRGLCIQMGFKSLAIVPIHYKETVLGAFHIADRREGMVPMEKIEFIESISPLVGEAILRFSAEEKLLKSESRLSEAQRVAHLGNWDWNIQTNQLYWSDEIYRIFGLSPQQFGATYDAFLDSVHPDDREAVKKAVNEALYEKKPYSIDHRIVMPDGSVRTVHEQAEVMFDDSVKPVRMLGIVHDITDRKRAEEKLKESYEQLRNLSEHLQSIREEERTNIAREIHDELGQALTALKIDISMIVNKLYPDHKPLVEKTESMMKRIDETIQTVKKICTELRPTVIDHFGLSAAIEWQAEDFQKTTGINCEVSFHPEDIVLDQDISIVIFRIFQEALTNIMRHADATEVKANLKAKDGMLTLEVKDNGKGITEEQITNSSSFGLLGIRERVNFLSGNVTISGIRNEGSTIKVNIPFKKKRP